MPSLLADFKIIIKEKSENSMLQTRAIYAIALQNLRFNIESPYLLWIVDFLFTASESWRIRILWLVNKTRFSWGIISVVYATH